MKNRFKGRMWRHPGNQALVLLLIALFLMLAAVPAASASSSASPAASTGQGSTIFRVGWLLEPDNLNPFIGLLGQDYEIWHLNYDFLVGFNPKDLSPRPELAESWSVSPDGKTWTFKIRKGVKWQDGQPLTAKDVAFTFNYIVKNDLQTIAIYTGGITGAKAIDDYTAQITTEQPKANMLAMIVPIIPEHIWSKVSGKAATTTFQNSPPIVGSGPFQTVEWSKGKYIRMVANPNYWGGKPKVDELIFENYTNADTMTADLKQGGIDAAVELPQAQFPSLLKTKGVTGLKGTHWRFNELGFNCYDSPNSLGNPVLLDEKFRHALNWAIDRQKITDVAFFGQADVGSTLIVPYSVYHWQPPADQLYTYDPAKTKAELDAAGYKDVDGDGFRETKDGKPLSLRLLVTTDSPENQTAAKLIAGWFKDVGLKVNLKVVDSGVLLNAQYNYKGNTYAPDYDMYIWYWTYDYDPDMMLGVPTPQQIEGWNDTLWTNPEYTKLFTQQEETIDVQKRIPLVQRMQQIAYQSSPYLIFAYPYQLEAYRSDKWQGVVPSPTDTTGYDGAAFYNYMNVDTYTHVEPKVATESSSSSSNSTTLTIVVIVVVVVAAALAVWLLARRRGRSVEM
jgi:peptide/nickel transport system substrate-binding protein